MPNQNTLATAKKNQSDEFYTRFELPVTCKCRSGKEE